MVTPHKERGRRCESCAVVSKCPGPSVGCRCRCRECRSRCRRLLGDVITQLLYIHGALHWKLIALEINVGKESVIDETVSKDFIKQTVKQIKRPTPTILFKVVCQ